MRIYAVADIHGKPAKIESIRKVLIELKPDALVDDTSVLVVHSPPRGVLDHAFGRFHAGCRRLYQLVVQCQPRLVLCGHIHEIPGIASIGQTTVVNCNIARTGRGAMVDFDPEGSLKVKML
jgi:Icc-related predicted phosphoesterase